MDIVLVIDESGAKGYSTKEEKSSGEIGVMVGYLIPKEHLSLARNLAISCFSSITSNTKIHLTDLTREQQKAARNIVYTMFSNNELVWFYNAIYSQGFYESHNKESRGGLEEKELLHSKLFSGVFLKALYRLHFDNVKNLNITIISDTLDKKIIRIFKEEISYLVKILTNHPLEKTTTHYDKKKKELYQVETITVTNMNDKSILFDSIEYDIQCEDSSITFIADILANSTLYYLNKSKTNQPNIELNSKQAISEHPLSKFLMGCHDLNDKAAIPFFDIVYRREKI